MPSDNPFTDDPFAEPPRTDVDPSAINILVTDPLKETGPSSTASVTRAVSVHPDETVHELANRTLRKAGWLGSEPSSDMYLTIRVAVDPQ